MALTIQPSEKQKQSGFAKLLENEAKQGKSFEEGSLVEGKVVQITDNFVVLDVGFKAEGRISISEFKDTEGKLIVEVGSAVEVLLDSTEENEQGIIQLSKEKADLYKAWDSLVKIQEEGGLIDGVIVSKVKGGLSVDIGVKAFLPGSQVDLRPARNLDRYVGKKLRFKILKLNKRRGNVVVSRKEAMEAEGGGGEPVTGASGGRHHHKDVVLPDLKEGQTTEGRIKNITDFGAFIDLGGCDGLLHVTDMSWGRVSHPSDLFSVGQNLKVIVLKVDQEAKKISLGYKQLSDDPWTKVENEFPVGSKIKGRVTSLTDYGAFIELAPGVEGLVHVSEISWNKALKNPSQELSVGQIAEAIVLDSDITARRIALGMKQLKPNPWDLLEKDHPVGAKVKGVVRHITDFGAFVDCGIGLDGLVHISDLAWIQNFKHPTELVQKGEKIEAVVLQVDRAQERFSLGLKQLKPNPWETIKKSYLKGAKEKGTVEKVADYGAQIRLEENVVALCPKNLCPDGIQTGAVLEVEVEAAEEEARKFLVKPVA